MCVPVHVCHQISVPGMGAMDDGLVGMSGTASF